MTGSEIAGKAKKGQIQGAFDQKRPEIRPVPPAPKDLDITGRRLWRALQKTYEFDAAESQLLLELCRCADTLERLAAAQHGRPLAQPILQELRAQRITYARLFAALRMPDPEDALRRPQRRTGVRDPYRPQFKVV